MEALGSLNFLDSDTEFKVKAKAKKEKVWSALAIEEVTINQRFGQKDILSPKMFLVCLGSCLQPSYKKGRRIYSANLFQQVEFRLTNNITGGYNTAFNTEDKILEAFGSLNFPDSDTEFNVKVKTKNKKNWSALTIEEFTINQRFGQKDTISPRVIMDHKNGDRMLFQLEWRRKISFEQSIMTTMCPTEKWIMFKWNDGPWTADIHAPYTNFIQFDSVTVKINRELRLS